MMNFYSLNKLEWVWWVGSLKAVIKELIVSIEKVAVVTVVPCLNSHWKNT